jgi:hypothetical protein
MLCSEFVLFFALKAHGLSSFAWETLLGNPPAGAVELVFRLVTSTLSPKSGSASMLKLKISFWGGSDVFFFPNQPGDLGAPLTPGGSSCLTLIFLHRNALL